ncbi:MAG: uncharacterized protein A8A55_1795 [Amphiamblys sp. WSBS2006]|nr:MAG: uncharacterized protein A8A55_1795 [Amphiamblys sp. WSBS2006]
MERQVAAAKARKRDLAKEGRSGGFQGTKKIHEMSDAEGIVVEPIFVLIFSLGFIFSIFILHILGRIFH